MDELDYPALCRIALGFVLEDESWPVFTDWVRANHNTVRAQMWVASASLAETRKLWMLHSADPDIAALGGILSSGPGEARRDLS